MESFSFEGVASVDLSPFYKYAKWNSNSEFFEKPEGEHYKLLSYLSSQLPAGSTVIDIGTFLGFSAVALATNPDVKVITYDIKDLIPTNTLTLRDLPNVQRRIGDCMRDFAMVGFVDKVKLILMDVDPHDGVQERVMIDGIIKAGYKGIMLLDDIYLNEDMASLWEWAKKKPGMKSMDVSQFGHWSGTGLLDFSNVM